MISLIKKSWQLLDRDERREFLALSALILLAALAAIASVAITLPFLRQLTESTSALDSRIIKRASELTGLQSERAILCVLGAASVLLLVVCSLIQAWRTIATAKFVQHRSHSLSMRLLEKHLLSDFESASSKHTGDYSATVLNEVQYAVAYIFLPVADFLAAATTSAGLLAFMVYVSPYITISAIGIAGVAYGSMIYLTHGRLRRVGEERAVANALRFRRAAESLSAFKEARVTETEHSVLRAFAGPSRATASANVRANVFSNIPQHLIQFLFGATVVVGSVFVLTAPALASPQQRMQLIPVIGALAVAGQRLIPELNRMYRGWSLVQYGRAALVSIHTELCLSADERRIELDQRELVDVPGMFEELRLDNVSYSYPDQSHSQVTALTSTVRRGEAIGIIGRSGSGKSTLLGLLLGLASPKFGSILVNGVALDRRSERSWRRRVGYVPQEILLLDATIAENIAFGVEKAEIDLERVKRAARIACIDEYVEQSLPESYWTLVGEHGGRLSGGQRQRIGIARAVYRSPEILILDEATSALDEETEAAVMRSLDLLSPRPATIMVAHRLAAIRACDRVWLMRDGCLEADGEWESVQKVMDGLGDEEEL